MSAGMTMREYQQSLRERAEAAEAEVIELQDAIVERDEALAEVARLRTELEQLTVERDWAVAEPSDGHRDAFFRLARSEREA